MSYSFAFFATDMHSARRKLHEAYAPAGVKALVECALNAIPQSAGQGACGQADDNRKQGPQQEVNHAIRMPLFRGVLVESNGHIDENGGRSGINVFRVEPFYD